MISKETYLQWMEEYFNRDYNSELKDILITASENKTLLIYWHSPMHGHIGMPVRNYMRENHPEIDDDFPNYGDFEDYSYELIKLLIDKWKNDYEKI